MKLSDLMIYAGGPGSGCNPEVGVCGRKPGSGAEKTKEDVGANVAKKFERYEKMVNAVANRKINGLAVFGERGIGKSKTVIDALAKTDADVTKIRGEITPKELFNTLSQHRGVNDIVWFDDADSAFKNTTALNILKAALDSDEPREISWLSSKKEEGEEQTFSFKGRIIVTTNIDLANNEHVAALVDRMHWINLKLNAEEKMHRIDQVGMPMLEKQGLDTKTAKQVMDFVRENKDDIGDMMSLRVVKKIGEVASFDPDWKETAKAQIEEAKQMAPEKPAKYQPPTVNDEGESTPSRRGGGGEGRPKMTIGTNTPKKYAAIAHKNGFYHSGGNTYTNSKGHKITFSDRSWRITPAKGGGREKKGEGAPDFRSAIKMFAAGVQPKVIGPLTYTPGRWHSIDPAYM